MADILFLEQAILDFYWPHLEILWNPPSKVHWIKALSALKECTGDECPIPPNLILAAARVGQAGLRNRHTVQEIVMNDLFEPMSPKEWDNAWCGQERDLKKDLQRQNLDIAEGNRIWWRPLEYQSMRLDVPAHLKIENKEARWRGNHLSSELKKEQSLGLNYFRFLYIQCQKSLDRLIEHNERRIMRNKLQISFRKISSSKVESPNCIICYDNLVDADVLTDLMLKAAALEPDLAKRRHFLKDLPTTYELDDWNKKLVDNTFNPQEPHDEFDKMVKTDLRHFVCGLTHAFYRFKTLMGAHPEHMCIEPTALACGHIFGFNCIEAWVAENRTCPHCRAQLEGLQPQLHVYQQIQEAQVKDRHMANMSENTEEAINDVVEAAEEPGAIVETSHGRPRRRSRAGITLPSANSMETTRRKRRRRRG